MSGDDRPIMESRLAFTVFLEKECIHKGYVPLQKS